MFNISSIVQLLPKQYSFSITVLHAAIINSIIQLIAKQYSFLQCLILAVSFSLFQNSKHIF